ncbi:MAG TPA: tannase/feruloyl esterase family alpha/beta hydrolase [Ramlibacter sp.]|jgi:feruloyl esterase|uniref:tannase/feruloyl esterase family alpha/beta hydrolase n=1 Tax=Ramlibacter sp. TaxID=1917967 RepID=UPI002D5ABFB6|nr:tannase/feruloyl esterase family alpha/beta hydrolase [Ramlibacter sp.]HZY18465.1 tannase/feruloyl esterase family alpha/beta hydrolase [Ramlibacter sp.]
MIPTQAPWFAGAAAAATAAALLAGCASQPATPTVPAPIALRQCEALAGMTVPAGAIGLPTRGAVIATAERAAQVSPYRDAEGEHLLPTPARCLVQGRVLPVDPAAPPIQFAINLPLSNWNGRALQSGGGGLGGQVITAPGSKASGRFDPNPVNVPYPITLGYATFGSDGGHPRGDFRFTRSDEAMRNWAHEELKKTRDTALAVIEAAYGRRPSHVFFSGESAGGREALRAAQVYPQDYDGVIATSPVISWYPVHLFDNQVRDRLADGGFLDARAIRLVAERTRASCDLQDGLQDGVVARYLECPNDAAQLQCAPGQPGGSCLSGAQVAAVNALREPRQLPVPFAHGVTRFPGFAVTGDEDGSGWQWPFYPIGLEAPSRPLPPGMGFEPRRGAILNFGAFLIRHTIVQRDDFDPFGFDARPHAERILQLSRLFDATDPDLSRFAARGGKLILVHPSADNAAPLTMAAEWYGSVVGRLGQAATDGMLRFYVPAGGSHNVGGTSQVDALAMLEDWVLRGRLPPDAPVAFNLGLEDMRFIRSMPACRFPAYPRYDGSGDPNQASSFTCVPRPQLLQARQR